MPHFDQSQAYLTYNSIAGTLFGPEAYQVQNILKRTVQLCTYELTLNHWHYHIKRLELSGSKLEDLKKKVEEGWEGALPFLLVGVSSSSPAPQNSCPKLTKAKSPPQRTSVPGCSTSAHSSPCSLPMETATPSVCSRTKGPISKRSYSNWALARKASVANLMSLFFFFFLFMCPSTFIPQSCPKPFTRPSPCWPQRSKSTLLVLLLKEELVLFDPNTKSNDPLYPDHDLDLDRTPEIAWTKGMEEYKDTPPSVSRLG